MPTLINLRAARLYISVLLLVTACGPRNTKPADPSLALPGCAATAGPTSAESLSFSKDHHFAVLIRLKNPGAVGAADLKAQVGENPFTFKVMDRETLQPIKDAVLVVKTLRIGADRPSKKAIAVDTQPDGSFLAVIPFKRSGNYEVQVHIVSREIEDDSFIPISF